MYENYIFDLYGTLIDIHTNERKPSLWKGLSWYMAFQGACYEPRELRKAYALRVGELCVTPETEVNIADVISKLYSEKGIEPSQDIIEQWALIFRGLSIQHLRLYEGARDLLLALRSRGKGVYLLSNAQRLFTEPELRALDIYDLFDDILISSDIGYKKPSGKFYAALLQKHGLDPASCVMVGNDWQADAWGAHNSGIASMYLHTPQSPQVEGDLPPDCKRLDYIFQALHA